MTSSPAERLLGILAVVFASVLWGSTGTAATFAPQVSPLAIGAVAMGIGGLLQALIAARGILRHRRALTLHWRILLTGGLSVGIYPLAFYASMHLAGVTVGTVISIGSAPLLSALIEYWLEGQRLTRRWMTGAPLVWPEWCCYVWRKAARTPFPGSNPTRWRAWRSVWLPG